MRRCLKPFCRDMRVPVDSLLAETLEDEENDEILLLDNGTVDLDEVFTTALVLAMDSKHVCSEDCKGLVRHLRRGISTRDPGGCKPEIDPRLLPSRSCWIKSLSKFCPAGHEPKEVS